MPNSILFFSITDKGVSVKERGMVCMEKGTKNGRRITRLLKGQSL